jgi:hypothetical protein
MSQKDIYRSAHQLIRQHGEAAEEIALSRMQKYMDVENLAGASAWLMIAQAIKELQDMNPSGVLH